MPMVGARIAKPQVRKTWIGYRPEPGNIDGVPVKNPVADTQRAACEGHTGLVVAWRFKGEPFKKRRAGVYCPQFLGPRFSGNWASQKSANPRYAGIDPRRFRRALDFRVSAPCRNRRAL